MDRHIYLPKDMTNSFQTSSGLPGQKNSTQEFVLPKFFAWTFFTISKSDWFTRLPPIYQVTSKWHNQPSLTIITVVQGVQAYRVYRVYRTYRAFFWLVTSWDCLIICTGQTDHYVTQFWQASSRIPQIINKNDRRNSRGTLRQKETKREKREKKREKKKEKKKEKERKKEIKRETEREKREKDIRREKKREERRREKKRERERKR